MVSGFATRISGSSDLYADDGRKPFHSINYVTAHDGFTMNDLVSYNDKHNFLNGENNRDGGVNNLSYNYGAEGETRDEEIREIRNRQTKNFLATLLLSVGTPMLLGGDELRRTQFGNNNAYCQDNAISWFDYSLKKTHADLFRFCSRLIDFRKNHAAFRRPDFFTGRDNTHDSAADVSWYNELGTAVDWSRAEGLLAFRLDGTREETGYSRDDTDFYVMLNATLYDQYFTICAPRGRTKWRKVIDTALPSPLDFAERGGESTIDHKEKMLVDSRSFVLLIGY